MGRLSGNRSVGWGLIALLGCGGEPRDSAATHPWALSPAVASAGSGIPFCDEAMAGVVDFMSRFEGQMPPSGEYGGTAVVGGTGELSGGMNGLASPDTYSTQHQIFVHGMTLLQYDENLEPQPYLAESWEVDDETTELTFFLRDDVLWHDGEPTTAYDVAFTFERATDPETGFSNSAFWTHYQGGASGVEIIDSFTVKIALRPHADFLDPWRTLTIMPRHLLEDVPPAELKQHPIGTVCPVGNGPFIFTQHRQDASWSFQANPAFPEGLGGRPRLDRYQYRMITEQNTLLADLLTESIDVFLSVPPGAAQRVVDAQGLRLVDYPGRNFVFVGWNSRQPQLADKRVRLALTLGTNRQEIFESLADGRGAPAFGSIPPFHWAYDANPQAESMPYDPDRARALLDEAGWRDRDGDGVRENSEGLPLAISIKYNPDEIRRGIAEVMQAQLASIGVAVTPQVVEWSTLVQQFGRDRDFDGVVISLAADFKLDDTGLFHSAEGDGLLALAGTARPDIDRLLEALPLLVDRSEAIEVWREYQRLLMDEQPFTFVYYPNRLHGVNERLNAVRMDVRGAWINLREWWIAPEERR